MTPGYDGGVSVAIPGPWWTNLTYAAPENTRAAIAPGVRARVPVGGGTRVGLVVESGDTAGDDYAGNLREITEIIDEAPVLSWGVMPLLRWFCDAHLCGFGTAMKTLLPAGFLSGESIEPAGDGRNRANAGDTAFVYEPEDAARLERYVSLLAEGAPSLVSFPIYRDAGKFFDHMLASPLTPPELKGRILLYPRTSGKAEWAAWLKLHSPGDDTAIVIGGQNSAMAPLRGLARIVVEDESNNVWRAMRPPIYNARSLLAARAKIEGAALVLGGRMPSPRAFMRYDSEYPRAAQGHRGKKIIFVDMKLAYTPSVEGVSGGLAVSEPLVRETEASLGRGRWAIWILDRKGYAGEIICEECGGSLKCPKCGGTLRLEDSAALVVCVSCGRAAPAPDECPNCSGRLLSARRPGLEALMPLADAAVTSPVPILSYDADEKIERTLRKIGAGVMLGTRAALALCDSAPVGLIGWIDADGEARSGEHDSRVRAYSLIWESCWRGLSPRDRRVLIQTRRPGGDWQKSLDSGTEGWRIFWREELRERKELSMPPYTCLIKVEGAAADISSLDGRLAGAGYERWSPDDSGGKSALWIRTKKLAELRRILSPYFHIRRAGRFPSVTVWHE
jgi:primosomal protein N' (replication factor Y)